MHYFYWTLGLVPTLNSTKQLKRKICILYRDRPLKLTIIQWFRCKKNALKYLYYLFLYVRNNHDEYVECLPQPKDWNCRHIYAYRNLYFLCANKQYKRAYRELCLYPLNKGIKKISASGVRHGPYSGGRPPGQGVLQGRYQGPHYRQDKGTVISISLFRILKVLILLTRPNE